MGAGENHSLAVVEVPHVTSGVYHSRLYPYWYRQDGEKSLSIQLLWPPSSLVSHCWGTVCLSVGRREKLVVSVLGVFQEGHQGDLAEAIHKYTCSAWLLQTSCIILAMKMGLDSIFILCKLQHSFLG